MKPTKYFSSMLLRFRSFDRFLFRFAERNEIETINPELIERIRNCMIYLICSRPIVNIIPETFKKVNDQFEFSLSFRINCKELQCKVKLPKAVQVDMGGKVEVSDFPHKSILSYDADSNLVHDLLISNFIHVLEGVPEELANHEVLYVGKGTSDCAIDRLDGHSTLERILADILQKDPSKEVALLINSFKMQKNVMTSKEIGEKAEIRGELAKKHFEEIFKYKPDIDEQSKIIEALLIDYFKTAEYNSHYTNGLSSNMSVLKNVYDLDFDAVIVELNNENIGNLNIYSKSVDPHFNHQAVHDLRKLEGRISLLDPNSFMSQ